MLAVTDPALMRLLQRLKHEGVAAGMALRFKRREGGWTLCVDRESPGDTRFTYDNRTVLLLDADVSQTMANLTLDARGTGQRTRLRLRRNKRRGD